MYYSNRAVFMDFTNLAAKTITDMAHEKRAAALRKGLTAEELQKAAAPVTPAQKGLYKRDAKTGELSVSDQNRFAGFFVPFILIMLMFMIIMSGATPLMQGIVEEKMQRIAEVLLGSFFP